MSLDGKRAVVTGSTKGIGLTIAKSLAAHGVKVVINARGSGEKGPAEIDEIVQAIRTSGGQAVGLAASIADPGDANNIIECCVKNFGGIDILVNNAAILNADSLGPIGNCAIDKWDQTIRTNLSGAFYVTRAALPYMTKQRWGRILNASSHAGTGKMGGSAYSTAKAGLFGFTRALASDYGPYGITANAYNPEANTSIGGLGDPQVYEQMKKYWLVKGFYTEAEIANIKDMGYSDDLPPWVTYLCTEEANNINGHVFAIESRRIALLAWPDEQQAVFHDFKTHGLSTVSDMRRLAALAFPLQNRWPARSGSALTEWENAAPGAMG